MVSVSFYQIGCVSVIVCIVDQANQYFVKKNKKKTNKQWHKRKYDRIDLIFRSDDYFDVFEYLSKKTETYRVG